MPTRSLPLRPNLDQLKIQARDLRRAHRDRDPSAAARVLAHLPEMAGLPLGAVLDRRLALAEAQLVIAREYGFSRWANLKHHVELGDRIRQVEPHPRFDEALAALDAGALDDLRRLLAADASLVYARTNLEPPYGYFSGATLLHHVAGNPRRDHPLPANIVEVARALLDAGADVRTRTLGPNGGDTMGLLLTSRQASDLGVTGPLMDLLLERGAALDVTRADVLRGALANHAPRAAEKLIDLGAKPDVLAAAALGRMDLLRGFFDGEGSLRSRSRHRGRQLSSRDTVGLALLFAYVRGQREAVDFLLEKDGNWDVVGVNNGTVLHRAAWDGDLEMVRRLVAQGADVSNRNNPFTTTPLAWAEHNHQTAVFEWLRAHAPIDLHDAVSFGLREQVEARLRQDPASVNERRDQWDLPQCTPLHCAAFARREDLAALLLEKGADPNLLAGDGTTALDIADARDARGVAAILERHGGARTPGARKPRQEPDLKPFERLANDILGAYRTGDRAAVERIQAFLGCRVSLHDIRIGVERRLQKSRETEISPAEARDVVAGLRGFGSWPEFADQVRRHKGGAKTWALPPYWIDEKSGTLEIRRPLDAAEWDSVVAVMKEKRIATLDANGQMTDDVMERLRDLDHVTSLRLANSAKVTDAGLRHLASLRHLRHLDLSGCGSTDRGLDILRELSDLRTFTLNWHEGVSDASLAGLAACEQLERVDLLGSPVGDGVIAALTGKDHLRHLKTGRGVTDAGLAPLHRFPAFRTWHGGDVRCSLMSFDVESGFLLIDGPFTDRGMATLPGLDGVFGLSLFRHSNGFTASGLAPLAQLKNLGFLGCGGERCTDEVMGSIATLPRLRVLMAQGTVASDIGFEALSRSPTLEYLWGRECPNLTGRGFVAMSSMPSLRGLAVSCKRVDDESLAALARFPALRELMPMEVTDAGFRHVGRCENLEHLWCMYCRDTTDAATAHVAGLSRLKTYYAGQTKITDRSLEVLGRMTSLEKLEFWNCAGITDAGVAFLVGLPRLREVVFDACRQISPQVVRLFPEEVRVEHSA